MQVALRLHITHNRPCVAPVKAPGGSVRACNILKARGSVYIRPSVEVPQVSSAQLLERSCGHSLPCTRTLLPSRLLLDSDDHYDDDNNLELHSLRIEVATNNHLPFMK